MLDLIEAWLDFLSLADGFLFLFGRSTLAVRSKLLWLLPQSEYFPLLQDSSRYSVERGDFFLVDFLFFEDLREL